MLDSLINKAVTELDPMKPIGQKRRKQYTAKFKAEVIHVVDDPTLSFHDIALKYKIDISMVCRWIKKKESIFENAASSHRKLLCKERRAKKNNIA